MAERGPRATPVDLAEIRDRAGCVLEAMSQDCGPAPAEPYSSWAIEEARDVLALLDLIDRLREDLNRSRSYRENFEGLPEGTLPRV